jgi:hypothetical protein
MLDGVERRAVGLLANVLDRLAQDYVGQYSMDFGDAERRALDRAEVELADALEALVKARR